MTTILKDYFPQPLLDDIVKGNCLPIIGSGFSLNAIIPKGKQMLLWEQLGKKIGEYIPDYQYSNALDAISAYAHEFTRNKLIEKLTELLLVNQLRPGNAHKAFSKLPFKLICTTNFDFLLEQSYSYCRPILDESQLSISVTDNSVSVLKIHGDLHHPNKIVATEEDYDLFIERNPLFATFLSNQLIVKTPLFIGYSIDDPDFRQVFKVVNDRLGNSKRPAYTIKLNASHHEISKFERRGVKVINIIDKKLNYSKLFENIFTELETYWKSEILKTGTYTQEDTLSEIIIKDETKNRLCFFSIPYKQLSYYKQNIFPIAESYGLVPITADEVLTAGDTLLAKISALIDKSEILVFDLTNRNESVMLELGMATASKQDKKKILLIKDKEDFINYPPIDVIGYHIIEKPVNIYENYESFFSHIESWFKDISSDYEQYFLNEPARLFSKNEFRAAVVSAISLLEIEFYRRVNINDTHLRYRAVPMHQLIDYAFRQQLIEEKLIPNIKDWIKTRNRLVHTTDIITKDKAKKIVDGVIKIVKHLRQ